MMLPRQTMLIANRYQVEDPQANLLGQGGMGSVYRGLDTQTQTPVAIKVLKPDLVSREPGVLERFNREGNALRQLNHPNIVQMLAAHSETNPITEVENHYLVMEYVSGGSLRGLMDRRRQLPIRQVLEIGLELADALARAHHLDIIHRDLKPDNVLLAADGTPRLTDFGVARLKDSPRLTQSGMIVGTINYLSPEACGGEILDSRADIWSFGVMLYEMLAGVKPFQGESVAAIITAILTQTPQDILAYRPDCPPALAELINQMLKKPLELRLGSARMVAARLEAILQNQPVQAPAQTAFTPPLPTLLAPRPAQTEAQPSPAERRNQHILLEKVKNFWVNGVLEQSIPSGALIELHKRPANAWVERPWGGLGGDSGEEEPVPKDTLQLFQESDRSLLILGGPGTGKTITLLKLARDLVERAQKDSSQPVPVVLQLASWAEERGSLEDWLVEELNAKYQIPRVMGKAWLEANELVLLLDGLDEIPDAILPQAIRAINEFRKSRGLAGLVITTRQGDYQNAKVKLRMGGAIELMPLQPDQVNQYLTTQGLYAAGLKTLISQDTELAGLAKTPLWLNIMRSAYRDEAAALEKTGLTPVSLAANAGHSRRQRLIEAYVHRGYRRQTVFAHDNEKTDALLKWLAHNMTTSNQAVFLVEALQPSWIQKKWLRWGFAAASTLLVCLVTTMLNLLVLISFGFTLIPGTQPLLTGTLASLWVLLKINLVIAAVFIPLQIGLAEWWDRMGKPAQISARLKWLRAAGMGVLATLVTIIYLNLGGSTLEETLFIAIWQGAFYTIGFSNSNISLRGLIELGESLQWSWREALRQAPIGLIIGLLFGLLQLLMFPDDLAEWTYPAPLAVMLWVMPWTLVFFVTGGLRGRRIERTSRPNQATWISLRADFQAGVVTGAALGVLFWGFGPLYAPDASFGIIQAGMIFLARFFGFGGSGAVNHLFLRLFLWLEGVPWNLAGFLEHATDLAILRRVGGGYIFINRLVQDYFSGVS